MIDLIWDLFYLRCFGVKVLVRSWKYVFIVQQRGLRFSFGSCKFIRGRLIKMYCLRKYCRVIVEKNNGYNGDLNGIRI